MARIGGRQLLAGLRGCASHYLSPEGATRTDFEIEGSDPGTQVKVAISATEHPKT